LLASLRAVLREALATKKRRMRELAQELARERLAVRGAVFAMRQDALAALRTEIVTARRAAQDRRAAQMVEIRKSADSAIAAARAALAVDRDHAATQNRITAHEERRKRDIDRLHAETLAGGALHGAKLEKLRPLFALGRSVPTLLGESKPEALLRYAKAHPEEVHAILEPRAEQRIAKTKAEIAAVEEVVRTPNAYEAKRAARVERMRARAAKLRAESEAAHQRRRAISDRIPMGQPVLVGHHSERRHRRDLKKMDALTRKSLDLAKDADALDRRARFAEESRAISSDDPDAVAKLRAKLVSLGQARDKMRAANAAIRKGGDVVARLVALGFSEPRAKQLLEKDPMGRIGFPAYAMQNTSSEERRIKERIRQLEACATAPARAAETIGDATISEGDNRVRITFPGKPPEDVRRALKGAGFRWSPTAGAWQRFASSAAWFEARRVLAVRSLSPGPTSPGGAAP
jgi:hypothetical protein